MTPLRTRKKTPSPADATPRIDRWTKARAEGRFAAVFEFLPDAGLVMDAAILACNPQAAKLWSAPPDRIVGRTMIDFAPAFQPDGRPSAEVWSERLAGARSGQAQHFFWQSQTLGGQAVDAELSLSSLGPDCPEVLVILRDVTSSLRLSAQLARVQAEYHQLYQTARRDERLMRGLLSVSGDPVLIYDDQQRVGFANEAFTKVFGWGEAEVKGRPLSFTPAEEVALERALWSELRAGRPVVGMETRRLTKAGQSVPVSISAAAVVDEHRHQVEALFILRDVTVQRMAAEALQRAYEMQKELADRDSLTGLLNHRRLHEELAKELDRSCRNGEFFSLIMMDLNNFKRLNDVHGHVVGDEALRLVAEVLRRNCRGSDIIGRYGGDEFLVILPGAGPTGTRKLARRLIDDLNAQGLSGFGGARINLSASLGLSTYPLDSASEIKLVGQADRAMYQAKSSGEGLALAMDQASYHDLEKPRTYDETLHLLEALDRRYPYSGQHNREVTAQALRLGRALELEREVLERLGRAALIHDVGLIYVPEEILGRPGSLDAVDMEQVRRHPIYSQALLRDVVDLDSEIKMAVLHHHERWDGQGYPHGLRGREIPLLARVLAVADVVSAMLFQRSYRQIFLDFGQVCQECQRMAGSQLDPELVAAFLKASV